MRRIIDLNTFFRLLFPMLGLVATVHILFGFKIPAAIIYATVLIIVFLFARIDVMTREKIIEKIMADIKKHSVGYDYVIHNCTIEDSEEDKYVLIENAEEFEIKDCTIEW